MSEQLTAKVKSLPGAYVCPNCGITLDKNAVECGSCKADFSATSAWKPLPSDHRSHREAAHYSPQKPQQKAEPPAAVKVGWLAVFSLALGVNFLGYFTVLIIWGSREGRGLGAGMLSAILGFEPTELLRLYLPTALILKLLLNGVQIPRGDWLLPIFLLASVLLGLFLYGMHYLSFYGLIFAPILLAPALAFYAMGVIIVVCGLARRRVGLQPNSRLPK